MNNLGNELWARIFLIGTHPTRRRKGGRQKHPQRGSVFGRLPAAQRRNTPDNERFLHAIALDVRVYRRCWNRHGPGI